MIDSWPAAKTGMIVPATAELPEPSLRPARASSRRRNVVYVLVLLLPELLILGAVALVDWRYAVIGALAWAALVLGIWAVAHAITTR